MNVFIDYFGKDELSLYIKYITKITSLWLTHNYLPVVSPTSPGQINHPKQQQHQQRAEMPGIWKVVCVPFFIINKNHNLTRFTTSRWHFFDWPMNIMAVRNIIFAQCVRNANFKHHSIQLIWLINWNQWFYLIQNQWENKIKN